MSMPSSTIRRQPRTRQVFAGMRRYDRRAARLDVFLLDDAGWEIPLQTLDLSRSGVFVSSPLLYEVGQEHTLVMRSSDGELMVRVRGRVVRVEREPGQGRCGMAYEFLHTDARAWRGLGALVGESA